MPSRFDEPLPEPIPLDKRYDIYVSELNTRIIVYRSALIRGVNGLARSGRFDIQSEFFEIEQSNGQTVWVKRYSVLKFCEPGTQLVEEVVSPAQPTA